LPAVAAKEPTGPQYSKPKLLDGAWTRAYGEQANLNTGVSGRAFRARLWGADLGADKAFRLNSDTQLFAGAFIGYGRADQNFRNNRSDGTSDALQSGLYATWLRDNGWFADGLLKAARFSNKFTTYDASRNRTSGDYTNWGLGASVELGKQVLMRNGWFAEPSLQVSYARFGGKRYATTGENAFPVDQRAADVWQLRAGTRAGRTLSLRNGGTVQPYAKLGLVEQVSSGGNVDILGSAWRPNTDGLRAELGTGVIWQLNANNQLHLDYQAAFGQKYEKPWGFNAGYRRQF